MPDVRAAPIASYRGARYAVMAESATSDDVLTLAWSSLPGRPTSEPFDLESLSTDPRFDRVWVEDTWKKEPE